MECIIVGGGVIGMLSARELARAGCRVSIVERGALGGEASWAGGGILSPLYPWRLPEPVTALAAWGQRHYPELARELAADTGIDPQWERSGLLVLDTDESVPAMEWAARHRVALEPVEDPARITALEPACRPATGALWLPEVAQIRNPRLIRALRADLERRGVPLYEQTTVTSLLRHGDHIEGVRTRHWTLHADAVIVAAGAWSNRVLGELDIHVDVGPVRGQMLLYRTAPGTIRHILLAAGHYAIPRRDGLVLIGSTIEEAGFEKETTPEAREELRQAAESLAPVLAGCGIERHWSGLRPGSADEIPYIGPVPGVQGLFLNAGHFRNGLLLAPASARLMADIVLGRGCELDTGGYPVIR